MFNLCASLIAMDSFLISTTNIAPGNLVIDSTPSRTFFNLSFSLVKKSLSFFVILSKVPSFSCFSILFNLFMLFLIVAKFVSIPPNHLSLTQFASHLLDSVSITFLACFLVPTNKTFLPSDTIFIKFSPASLSIV